jgi:predicted nucleic acid-binding protein
LAIDADIAERWGRLYATTKRKDRDLIIAATALERGLVVATRNVKDFAGLGVRLENPFA